MLGLTAEQRAGREEILKDVLNQLAGEKLHTAPGKYLSWVDGDPPQWIEERNHSFSCQPIIDAIAELCEVCLRGAILLSRVRCHNQVDLWNLRFHTQDVHLLGGLFSFEEIHLMESAYETGPMNITGLNQKDVEKAVWFGRLYSDPRDRLKAIIENTLEFGTFTPLAPKSEAERSDDGIDR